MKQTCILILGMHRSGTSALTGTLTRLGVYLGKDLIPADDDNQKGYFENNKINQLNEKLLAKSKSGWSDVFYDVKKIEEIQDISELKALILEEYGYSKLFAIKDPRLIYLFPLYERALKELGIRIKVIIPYRNPYEVASSLHVRDGFSMEKGMLLWAYHLILAEKYSRGYDRVFIGFDELLARPKKTIARIDQALDLNLLKKYDADTVREFLSSDLKHHNIDVDNLSDKVPPVIQKLIAMRSQYNDPKSKKKFDRLGRELFAYRDLFYNEDFKSVYDKVDRLRDANIQVEGRLRELEDRLDRSTTREKELEEALQKTRKELAEANELLGEWKQKALQKDQTIAAKEKELAQVNEALKKKDQELTARGKDLKEAYQSIKEKELELAKREKEFTQIKDQQKKREQELATTGEELRQVQEALNEKNQMTIIKEQELTEAIEALRRKEKEVKAKDGQLLQARETIKEGVQALSDKEKELTQTKDLLSKKDQEMAQIKQALKEKERKLAEKLKELRDNKELLKQKESVIQTNKKAIDKQKEEIEALKDELMIFYEDSQCMMSRAVRKIKRLVK